VAAATPGQYHPAVTEPAASRLHLGCGRDIRPGYVNADRVALRGVDVVLDLEAPLPFRDRSFREIASSHVLEHVGDLLDLVGELHRVSQPGALLRMVVPHFTAAGSYTDPTHRRFFGYYSFDYFTDEGDYNFYTPMRFRILERRIRFYWINNPRRRVEARLLGWLVNLAPRFYERFICWMVPASELVFELEPVFRPPGGGTSDRKSSS
jgi:SAM-dependent methyltransferase